MLDSVFKNSRKFLGVPLAILVVVCIALATGGTALASYVTQRATVETAVMEPLTFSYNSPFDPVTHTWQVQLYACENATAYMSVANMASVDVPVSVVVTPDISLPGVTCTVLDIGGQPLTVIPAHYSMAVAIMVTVACDAPIPDGIETQTWTVDFIRG